MTTIVLIEHDRERVKSSSLSAINAAKRLGGEFRLLIIGHNLPQEIACSLQHYGAKSVLTVNHSSLEHPLADRYAAVVAHAAHSCNAATIIGGSSTFTKDILPRAAALVDSPMLTDVVEILDQNGDRRFVRPVYAGCALDTVAVAGDKLVLTCRGAAFPAPPQNDERSPIETLEVSEDLIPMSTKLISREDRVSDRPDLAEARVVVSGGRPLKDKATFDLLIGGLADALGGAAGATRAAVDAGIAPNDWQIGQTGRVVRPELYIAAGISGSVQHAAGIQDSRVIVAINKDPNAPIFEIATYGIVGDLYDIVPRLIEAAQDRTAVAS